jgi:hypothetical protein
MTQVSPCSDEQDFLVKILWGPKENSECTGHLDFWDPVDELLSPLSILIPDSPNQTVDSQFRSERLHFQCQGNDESFPACPWNRNDGVQKQAKRQRTDLSQGTNVPDAYEIVRFEELASKARSEQDPTSLERSKDNIARMVAYFSRLVLNHKDLQNVRSEAELVRWNSKEAANQRKWLQKQSERPDLDMKNQGEWALETRFEVYLQDSEPRENGFVKLHVLSRHGEPFFVLVDWLCKAEGANGSVGSVLMRRVLEGWPQCVVMLCTVKPTNPAPYAQQPADHAKVIKFYRKEGLVDAQGSGKLAFLREVMSQGSEEDMWSAWSDLRSLMQKHLCASLPVLAAADEARPISWWEHRGDEPTETARSARWARATAETGRGWLAVGRVVEVLWEGEWWFAEVRRLQPRGSGQVRVGYVDKRGVVTEVRQAAFLSRSSQSRRSIRHRLPHNPVDLGRIKMLQTLTPAGPVAGGAHQGQEAPPSRPSGASSPPRNRPAGLGCQRVPRAGDQSAVLNWRSAVGVLSIPSSFSHPPIIG